MHVALEDGGMEQLKAVRPQESPGAEQLVGTRASCKGGGAAEL